MSTTKARKGPLAEHPILVGFTEKEAVLLQRAAKVCDTKRTTFIHDAAIYWAEEKLKEAAK